MATRLLLGGAVLAMLVLLPVAIGDFAVVAPAQASVLAVPEPGTLTLLSAGLLALGWRLRRRGE